MYYVAIISKSMHSPHSFDDFYQLVKLRKVPFFIVFFLVVLATYALLFAIDFIPEPILEEKVQKVEEMVVKKEETQIVIEDIPVIIASKPLKIIFDTLGKEVKVLNPESREVAALDTALLSGAVRHPDSADFKTAGNIFILGHSSYLPNVINKNFQAFNGIQKLTWGDTIRLQSEDMEYVYRVQKVFQAKASDVSVPYTPGKALLTLATCNSFGSKDDRFVVEAVLVDSKAL